MTSVSAINEHWIKDGAVTIKLNAFDNPDLLQVSILSKTVIMAYKSGVINYDAGHNYRTWELTGAQTKLETSASYNVYARLDRNGDTALLIYSTDWMDINGRTFDPNADEEDENAIIGPASQDYYFIYLGTISAYYYTNDGAYRTWITTLRNGTLATDQYIAEQSANNLDKMFKLNETDGLIEVLKTISSAVINTLTVTLGLTTKEITIGDNKITGIATADPEIEEALKTLLATTNYVAKYTREHDLSRKENDIAEGVITFLRGLISEGKIQVNDVIHLGDYIEGLIGGSGGMLDNKGNAVLESLKLRGFAEIPELRFNRIDVVAGELWNSIAFGIIESVDLESMTATIKLEDGERCGLKVNDICRGIFSNFGEGTQAEEVDDCGFQAIYGFSTCYFTPTEIIKNEAGVFQFRYAIKAGTTVHPCTAMKFAVYGNFTDSTRQASAYSTRTYTRYLNKVDTWEIDPSKHVYMQVGLLDGLVINGVALTGYGSYMTNSYLKGVQIQLTQQQKDELKGESAYSVSLSDSEAVMVVDDDGNIIIGATEELNVISGTENVINDEKNVIMRNFSINTRVQAFCGSDELAYSPYYAEGCYTFTYDTMGCEAMVLNGVLIVTSVQKDIEKAYIDLHISCEGKASFEKRFSITTVKNGRSPITADLSNEMDAVACDSAGRVLFGLPLTTSVSMWYGTTALTISKIEITPVSGVTTSVDGNVIKVTSISASVGSTTPLQITAYAKYLGEEYHKTLTFTITKQIAGENAQIYQLQPSVSSIKVDDADDRSVDTVTCAVTAYDGKSVMTLDSLPEGITIKYQIDSESASDYTYLREISTKTIDSTLTFSLYSGDTLIDRETIPVIIDGKSVVVADLTNEMCNVACDADGNYVAGLPFYTQAKLYYASHSLTLSSLQIGSVDGVTVDKKEDGTILISEVTKEAADRVEIPITLSAKYSQQTFTRTINIIVLKTRGGQNAVAYDLLPSVSVVSIGKDGTKSASSVSCRVRCIDGKNAVTTPASLPSNLKMTYSVDGGAESNYTYNSAITIPSTEVAFYLYLGSTLIDKETIPVVYDGSDGDKGENAITGYITNSNVGVACDYLGHVLEQALPLVSKVGMYDGVSEVKLSNIGLTLPDGVKAETDPENGEFSITSISDDTAESFKVDVKLFTVIEKITYIREVSLTVNKNIPGPPTPIYDLRPSANVISVDKDKKRTPSTISCGVVKSLGLNRVEEVTEVPSGKLTYSIDDGEEIDYSIGTKIDTTSIKDVLWFYLYVDGVLKDSEDIHVIKDGEDSVTIDLDNGNQSVPCEYTGHVLTRYLPVSATVSLWRGSTPLTLTGITLNAPTGVTASYTLSTGVVKVTAIADDSADTLPIKITASAKVNDTTVSKEATFTITKSKQGQPATWYDLVPSVDQIVKNSDGTTTPSVISCKVKKGTGSDSYEELTTIPTGKVTYSINGGTETTYTIGSEISTTSLNKGDKITFFLYVDDTQWDFQDINVIGDGAPGEDGKDGEDSVTISCTNQSQMVVCDYNWHVLDSSLPRTFNIEMHSGTTKLSLTDLTITTPTGVTAAADKSAGTVTVTAITDAAAGTLPIVATATAKVNDKDVTREITLVVNKNRQGDPAVDYDLRPSCTQIKQAEDGTKTPTKVSCKVVKIVGTDEVGYVTSIPSGKVTYAIDGGTEKDYTIGSEISTASITDEIYFYLYRGDTVESQNIGVVKNGVDGDTITATEIKYGVSDSSTVKPTTWYADIPSAGQGKYLWKWRHDIYSSGKTVDDYIYSYQGVDGKDGKGEDGVSIKIVTQSVTYGVSSSSSTKPTTWYADIPKVSQGQYLWTRTYVVYSDNNTTETFSYSYQGINGTDGKDGADGTNGKDGVDGTNGKDGKDGTNGKDGTDGANAITGYIDNSNVSIACESDGTVLSGYLPFSVGVGMYNGLTDMALSNITLSLPSGVDGKVDVSNKLVTISSISASSDNSISVGVSLSGKVGSTTYTRNVTLSISKNLKGKDAVIYDLVPSVSVVKIDGDGNITPTYVSCGVNVTDGDGTNTVIYLLDGYMEYSINGGSHQSYTKGSNVQISSTTTKVTFYLYKNNVLVDSQDIPVVRDGSDGTSGEDGDDAKYIYRYDVETPSTPSKSQIEDYSCPSGWSDSCEMPEISYSCSGEFSDDANGFRASQPDMSDSATCTDTITVTTTKENSAIFISVITSSERSYDELVIGKLDYSGISRKNSDTYVDKVSGDPGKKVVRVDIPTAGTHTIEVSYQKDSSGKVGEDRARYKVVDIYTCYMCSAKVNDGYYEWYAPTLFIQDSPSTEYIYMLSDVATLPSTPYSAQADDYIPPVAANAYKSTVTYSVGDVVAYGGYYYRCIVGCFGMSPAYTTYWKQIKTWTDNPGSVSEEWKYLYASTRKKRNGVWGDFCEPYLFGMYAEGEKGADGVMLRPRGEWNNSTDYEYTDSVRDIVLHDGNYFMVSNKGTLEAPSPEPTQSSEGYDDGTWTMASKYIFIATDVLLADGANIAGFAFSKTKTLTDGTPVGVLRSQNGTLSLNAETGKLIAKDAELSGSLSSKSGSTTVDISATAEGMRILYSGQVKTTFTGDDKTENELFVDGASGETRIVKNTISNTTANVQDYGATYTLTGPKNGNNLAASLYDTNSKAINEFTVSSPSIVTIKGIDTNTPVATATISFNNAYSTVFQNTLSIEIRNKDTGELKYQETLDIYYDYAETWNASNPITASWDGCSISLTPGTYTLSFVSVITIEKENDSTAMGNASVTIGNFQLDVDVTAYRSIFCGNGFSFGSSYLQHIQTVNLEENGVKVQKSECISGDAGWRVANDSLQLKIKGVWYTCSRNSDGTLKLE